MTRIQFEDEVREGFKEIQKSVERTGLGLHDHVDHMESGQLSKLMTSILDMTERIRKMEIAVKECQSAISDLKIEISDLQNSTDIGIKGR